MPNVRMNTPNDTFFLTAEALTEKSLLGVDRRQTLMDTINVAGAGATASSVMPASGVAVALVGVAAENPALAAAARAVVQATTRGNQLMGTSDLALGTFAQVSPGLALGAGSPAGTHPNIIPAGSNILLVNGDGSNPLWRIFASALTPPDTLTFYVYYIPLFADELSC